ncbi:MAG: hypothetical protein JO364_06585 [Pseudonocardiales bacterium]|nr:hypothetical protein [Pseudonocardiales bacterium]
MTARESAGAAVSVIDTRSFGRVPGGRAILLGRACGLAAGTLLACGSVLAGAMHVGDGSSAGESAPLLNSTPPTPGAAAGAPDELRDNVLAGRTSAAPEMVSVQAVTETRPAPQPRLGRVRRNNPVSVDVPAEPSGSSGTARQPWGSPPPSTGPAPIGPIAPVNPVLGPAAKGIGRVAPLGRVLAPTNPRKERKEHARSPRDERVSPYPAMAMLTSLLPTG